MNDGRLLSRVHDGSGVLDLRGVELLAGASSVTFLRGSTVPRAGSDQERSQQNFHLEEMFGNCEAFLHKTHSDSYGPAVFSLLSLSQFWKKIQERSRQEYGN